MGSKVVVVVDALRCLDLFTSIPDQTRCPFGAPELPDDLGFGALVDGRAFDADRVPGELEGHGAEAVIPRNGGGRSSGSTTGRYAGGGIRPKVSPESRSSE